MYDVAIIGGGFTGLALAYDLVKARQKVVVFEKDAELGGLAGTFEIIPGKRVEKFYHHWFTSDVAIIELAKELGLQDQIRALASNTGLYYANSRFRLSSPFDLLSFSAIPLIDRIRTGLMVLKARRIRDWHPLEQISAVDWIRKNGGERAFDVIWRPLLDGKFGSEAPNVSAVWFWNKLKLRGGSRGKKGGEELLYLEGGFQTLIKALEGAIKSGGGQVFTSTPVSRVTSENGSVSGVETPAGFVPAKRVVVTTPLPLLSKLAPELPSNYRSAIDRVRFLGNVCVVLRLNRSLSDTYWLNVADPSFPFVGIIEHTNFDPPENYGGERIAYLSKYLPTTEKLFRSSDNEIFEYCLPHIKRIFPAFDRSWVNGFSVWKAEYSQPVITKQYSQLVPDFKTPIEGLWLCTMAQVYPEDRGTNYAVAFGRKVAALMLTS